MVKRRFPVCCPVILSVPFIVSVILPRTTFETDKSVTVNVPFTTWSFIEKLVNVNVYVPFVLSVVLSIVNPSFEYIIPSFCGWVLHFNAESFSMFSVNYSCVISGSSSTSQDMKSICEKTKAIINKTL